MNVRAVLRWFLPWRWKRAGSREPVKLWGGPPTAGDECICAPGYAADPKCPQHGKKA